MGRPNIVLDQVQVFCPGPGLCQDLSGTLPGPYLGPYPGPGPELNNKQYNFFHFMKCLPLCSDIIALCCLSTVHLFLQQALQRVVIQKLLKWNIVKGQGSATS